MKQIRALLALLLCCALVSALPACGPARQAEEDGRPVVVATIFPLYDFVRQIAGELVSLDMLLPPGGESHSFEPTPQDMIAIQDCDLFLLIGGESDAWVDTLLSSLGQEGPDTLALIGCVDTLEEELAEGMQAEEDHDHGHDHDLPDEHIWTDPRNAMVMVETISARLCALDPDNAETYQANTAAYLERLEQLDGQFRDAVAQGNRRTIIMGDRFPFLYLAEAYGLDYYAAFPGCSEQTEASAATLAFLIDKLQQEHIPVVFHQELSNERVADILCESTGAKKLLLHACHSISLEDLQGGATYLSLMEQNVQNLKEALR